VEDAYRLKPIYYGSATTLALTVFVFLVCLTSFSSGQFLSLIILLSAEIVTAFSLYVAKADLLGATSGLFKNGTLVAAGLFFFSSLIATTFYIVLNPINVGALAAIEVGLLILFALVEVGLMSLGRSGLPGSSQSSQTQSSRAAFDDLTQRLAALRDAWPQSPERAKLEKFMDEVKYFNQNVQVDMDAEIERAVDKLDEAMSKGQASPEVNKLLDELLLLAKKREEEAIKAKRGHF
jgi:hypothetical protein